MSSAIETRCEPNRRAARPKDLDAQTTVEAAFALPIVFTLLLLLLQPAILLYDRIVMEGAAAEGCRLLSTTKSADVGLVSDYVSRRLGAVPAVAWFHDHETACYEIDCTGNEQAATVEVTIVNQVKPLPLLSIGSSWLGLLNGNGDWEVRVTKNLPVQPDWVRASNAANPSRWIGAWADD